MDTDELMVATIQAANGVDTYLKNVLREIINPVEHDFDMSIEEKLKLRKHYTQMLELLKEERKTIYKVLVGLK